MANRSFTVFRDVLDVPSQKPPQSSKSTRIPLRSTLENISTSVNPLFAADKENVHPVTGERSAQSKKRKPKSGLPLASKQSGSQQSDPEHKRRKSSAPSKKANTGTKKERKPSATARKTGQVSRRPSPLPPVQETVEPEQEAERLTAVEVDSRCYKLTVMPLADVSQAYDRCEDKGSSLNDGILSDKAALSVVKKPSAEPEIHDYFLPSLSSSFLRTQATSTTVLHDVTDFSTPERKQIYSAFTFSSPQRSPTAQTGSASVHLTTDDNTSTDVTHAHES